MYALDEALAAFLLDMGVISHMSLLDLRARVENTGEPLQRVLVHSGALSEDEVRRALSKVLGVPHVTLAQEMIMPEALAAIPEPFARAHGVVGYALRKEKGVPGHVLEVALLDTAQVPLLEELALPYVLRVRLTDRASLTAALLLYQKILQDSFGSLAAEGASPVDALLERALYSAAEALYLTPTESGYTVQYRIKGALYDALKLSLGVAQGAFARLGELARLSPGTTLAQEGSFKIVQNKEEILVRVALFPTVDGQAGVVTLVPKKSGRLGVGLESLGFYGQALADVRRALAARRGLVLVACDEGPQSAALLYGLLDTVGGYTQRIVTVEDRVGAHLPFALQSEVGEEFSAAARVRAALLQDPEILLVSPIKDRETALLVAEAANRGVFVLAGVLAPSAASGVEKLCTLGLSPVLLSGILSCVLGASPVRTLCPACREGDPHKLSRSEMSALESVVDFSRVLSLLKESKVVEPDALWRDVSFFHPSGCSKCQGGYLGYMSLCEVVPRARTVQEVLRAREEFEDPRSFVSQLEQRAREAGMLTRLESGFYQAAQGKTSVEEVLSIEA